MKGAPAIVLLVVGAAACGGALELLVQGGDRQTMEFEQVIAAAATWLLDKFVALARIMKGN